MIEVITHAEFVLRLSTFQEHLKAVKHILAQTDKSKIQLQELVHINEPTINPKNRAIECEVNVTVQLTMPEDSNKQKVDEYIEEIVPFLQRHLPNCNRINHTKIIQMKRILEDPNIHEYSVKFD